MARKTVLVCDGNGCGAEIEEGHGSKVKLTYTDQRRGGKIADLCDSCSEGMPGERVVRKRPRQRLRAVEDQQQRLVASG